MSVPGFWDNQETAQKVVSQLSAVKSIIEPIEEATGAARDLGELYDLAIEEDDTETLQTLEHDLASLNERCDKIEISGMLSGPDDMCDCFSYRLQLL